MDGVVTFAFFDTDPPGGSTTIERLSTVCFEAGFDRTERLDGANEATQVELVYPSDSGYGGTILYVNTFGADATTDHSNPYLAIGTDAGALSRAADDGSDTEFTEPVSGVARLLAMDLDPLYVASIGSPIGPPQRTIVPDRDFLTIEHLPWYGVYAQPMIDRFGGRTHVLDAPAWRTEELSTGSLLVITTRQPFDGGRTHQSVEAHLLEDGD